MASSNRKTGRVFQRSLPGHSPKYDRKLSTVVHVTPENMRQVWRMVTYPWVHNIQPDGSYTQHFKWVLVRQRPLTPEEMK